MAQGCSEDLPRQRGGIHSGGVGQAREGASRRRSRRTAGAAGSEEGLTWHKRGDAIAHLRERRGGRRLSSGVRRSPSAQAARLAAARQSAVAPTKRTQALSMQCNCQLILTYNATYSLSSLVQWLALTLSGHTLRDMMVAPSLVHVESDPIWAELVAEVVLRTSPAVRYVGAAADCATGLSLCRRAQPSLVLLGLLLPDGDGFELAEKLARQADPPIMLVLSSRCDEAMLLRLEAPHIAGFIWKDAEVRGKLRTAIGALLGGGRYFQPEAIQEVRRFHRAPDCFAKILSTREISLLDHFARGDSDEAIAATIGLSPNTVHSHRTHVISKVGLSGTVDLIRWAQARGFGIVRRRVAPSRRDLVQC